jgi:hypothetical protein
MAVQMKVTGQETAQAVGSQMSEALRVRVAPGSTTPQSFWWHGAWRRVLSIERIAAVGVERRCRAQTRDGAFELALDTTSGRWQMRRSPNWLARALAHLQNAPRYPLPAWRRRTGRRAARLAVARQRNLAASQHTDLRRSGAPCAGRDGETEWTAMPC